MSVKKCAILLVVSLLLLNSSISTAQVNKNVKRSIATVLFASLGGAVLGLSTLSFYGHPQDHTDNITAGALLGLAAGTGYLIYQNNQNAQPPQNYDMSQADIDKNKRAFAQVATKAPMIRFNMTF